MQSPPLMPARNMGQVSHDMEEGVSDGDDGGNQSGPGGGNGPESTPPSGGRTRGSRSATMGSDEWSRQRKDNHVRNTFHRQAFPDCLAI
jgi:bHLH factor